MRASIRLVAVSAVLGLIVGLASDLFIKLIQFVSHLIWADWLPQVHTQPWAVILVSAAAGLLMGLCVKFFGTNDEGIGFDSVLAAVKQDGELGTKQIKRVVLNTLPGLVTGASIGPESPLVTIGGFCGDMLAKALKTSKEQFMAIITVALGGSIGVLVDSPVAGPILFAEQPPTANKAANTSLVFASMVAASVGFALYYHLGAPLLAGDKLVPAYSGLHAIHLVYGLVIGLIGTLIGVAFKNLILQARTLFRPIQPLPRGLIVGTLVGICGAISPFVRFDGSAQLSELVANAAHYTVPMLLGLALLRLISTSIALGGGYQGGNIFPSIFIAGAVGLAINAWLPFIPAPVAMVSCMAATMYVFTPLPLFCIFLFAEISSFGLIPVMAMALVGGYLLQGVRAGSQPKSHE